MAIGFRGRAFVALFTVAAIAALVGGLLLAVSARRQLNDHIERALIAQARLAAELLSHREQLTGAAIPDEADRLGRLTGARVTLIAADGRVVGDSSVNASALPALENHAGRPEVVAARARGLGVSRRYSQTLRMNMVYVALPTRHPAVATVRLALPLTDVTQQLQAVWRAAVLALAVALVSALALAALSSNLLGRRLRAIAARARAYASGDLSHRILDRENDEIGVVARTLDDSVRQLAARMMELAEDRARLEAILTGMLEGVLVVDGGGRIQLANRAAQAMLALHADAVGHPYLESIRQAGMAAVLGQALAGRHPDPIEFQSARSDRWLVARAAPVAAGEAGGAVVVLHDVTDLRKSDQVRRDFVANVSHELRTPLTAIRGYLDALNDEPLEPGERERFMAVIARQTARMERLVRDLLRLASLDAREEPIEDERCAIDELLAAVVRDLAPSIDQKEQRVTIEVAPDLGPMLVDVPKLQDALRNIVENASTYAPARSQIRVAAAREMDRVVLRVEDEGPGIPPSDLERIFERFYRVDKARSRESGGTGLGLSIVKHLVQRLGGEVNAANRPNGGAVFTMKLPYHPATPSA